MQAELQEIRQASDWLEASAVQQGIPPLQREQLSLCLNEVLANIVNHGGAAASATPISIQFALEEMDGQHSACVTVSDSGQAFDPTTAVIKARPTSLADAEPGGLGLLLLRSNAEHLQYHYQQGRNTLRFCVPLEQQA